MDPSQFNVVDDDVGTLRQIKELLVSRDKKKVSYGIEIIEHYMQENRWQICFITTDVPEFLCKALVPCEPTNMRSILAILEMMAQHEEFYSHGHSSFAMETVVRSVHFIVKNINEFDHLIGALGVLTSIIQGHKGYKLNLDQVYIDQLAHLLLILSVHKQVDVMFQTGFLVHELLDSKLMAIPSDSKEVLLKCFGRFLDCLKNSIIWSGKIINLGCALSLDVLRLTVEKEAHSQELKFSIDDSEFEETLISNLISFLIAFGAPYFMELPMSDLEDETCRIKDFIHSLIVIFDKTLPDGPYIARKLSKMRFLHYATNIISYAAFRCGQRLQKLSMIVISKIIVALCDKAFLSSHIWPKEKHDLNDEILQGMSLLPLDPSQWLDILSDPSAHESSRLALVIYLYFYSLTAQKSDLTGTLCPAIIRFLNSVDIDCSALVVKTVWFIFVVTQLSSNYQLSQNKHDRATRKMVKLLEQQKEFSLVYTHHPALLYWVFSSPIINGNIQRKVVRLWLQYRKKDCGELDDLMDISVEIKYVLLDLLQNGSDEMVTSAVSTLKTAVERGTDNDLVSTIWYLLPTVLSRHIRDNNCEVNALCALELAGLGYPENPDMSQVVQTADLLARAEFSSRIPSLLLAFHLLRLTIDRQDFRVVNSFFHADKFMETIIHSFNTDEVEVVILGLKILSMLWRFQDKIDMSQVRSRPLFKANVMLKLMKARNVKILSTALEMLELLTKDKFLSTALTVTGHDSPTLTRLFCYQLINLGIKNIPETTALCWSCLQNIFQYSPVGPWLLEFIKISLTMLETTEMLSFLETWMDSTACQRGFDSGRRINVSHIDETVTFLSEALVQSFTPRMIPLCLKVLDSGVVLQNEVRNNLFMLCQRVEPKESE